MVLGQLTGPRRVQVVAESLKELRDRAVELGAALMSRRGLQMCGVPLGEEIHGASVTERVRFETSD